MKKILLPEIGIDNRAEAARDLWTDDEVSLYSPKELIEEKKLQTPLSTFLRAKKKYSELSEQEASDMIEKSPLIQSALLLDMGLADGIVAGMHYATADVLRAGIHIIGMTGGTTTASSSFLMTLPDGRRFVFGDCAVVVAPTSLQLAEIAIASVKTAKIHNIEKPSVAFLSFSTYGSAKSQSTDVIQEALQILQEHPQYDGFPFTGEVQFDTAIVPEIARKKAPDSPLANTSANILIFPDLNAGNITYKAVERLGGARALGPILQGFRRPINDLSRGCSVEDIVKMIEITANS